MENINGINGIGHHRIINNKENVNASKSYYEEQLYGIFYDKNKGVNGAIDEAVFQGKKGDCWLISGIQSLAYTKDGRELIKNSIKQDKNGDYIVSFKGIGKSYKVTKNELESKNVSTFTNGLSQGKSEYSTGDDDMLLMELAVEKAIKNGDAASDLGNSITGGSAYYLYEMMTDDDIKYAYGDDFKETANLLVDYKFNQSECSATLGVTDGFAGLQDDHAYAIKNIQNGYTTLVNPWNTSREIKISNREIIENIGKYDVSVVDVEG